MDFEKIKYFYINEYGHIEEKVWTNSILDKKRAEMGNYFKTVDEADFELERLKTMTLMKAYTSQRGGIYVLRYDYSRDVIYALKITKQIGVSGEMRFRTWFDAYVCYFAIGKEQLKKYYFRIKEPL